MAVLQGLLTSQGRAATQAANANAGWYIYPVAFAISEAAGTFDQTRVGAYAWTALTNYVQNQLVVPTVPNGHYYKAQGAGTTGASQPTFPTGSGATVIDGSITWQEAGTTSGGLITPWITAPISTRVAHPPDTIEYVLQIPPGFTLTNKNVGEIAILAQDQTGFQFLLVLAQPTATITYDKDGTTTLRLSVTITNTPITTFVFNYTQAEEIAAHDTDPNAHAGIIAGIVRPQTNLIPNSDLQIDRVPAGSSLSPTTATVTISGPATPAIVSWTNHQLPIGRPVSFTTTGALPAPLVAGQTYYVAAAGYGANSFQLSLLPGGPSINSTNAGSGVHTAQSGAFVYGPAVIAGRISSPGAAGTLIRSNVSLLGARGTSLLFSSFTTSGGAQELRVRFRIPGRVARTLNWGYGSFQFKAEHALGTTVYAQTFWRTPAYGVDDFAGTLGAVNQFYSSPSNIYALLSGVPNLVQDQGINVGALLGGSPGTPWTPNTVFALNSLIIPRNNNGYYYKATAISGTGTSGATDPAWPLNVGGTVVDNAGANQITWTNMGTVISGAQWVPNTAYGVNTLKVPRNPNGYYYKVTSISGSGTSGASDPAWNTTVGSTTTDNAGANQIVWTNMGAVGLTNGLEIEIVVPVGAQAGKNFEFTEFKLERSLLCSTYIDYRLWNQDDILTWPTGEEYRKYTIRLGTQYQVDEHFADYTLSTVAGCSAFAAALTSGARVILLPGATYAQAANFSATVNNVVVEAADPSAIINSNGFTFTLIGTGNTIKVPFTGTATGSVVLNGAGSKAFGYNTPIAAFALSNGAEAESAGAYAMQGPSSVNGAMSGTSQIGFSSGASYTNGATAAMVGIDSSVSVPSGSNIAAGGLAALRGTLSLASAALANAAAAVLAALVINLSGTSASALSAYDVGVPTLTGGTVSGAVSGYRIPDVTLTGAGATLSGGLYGFRSELSAEAGKTKYAFYGSGTAPSFFGGYVGVGSAAAATSELLVGGTVSQNNGAGVSVSTTVAAQSGNTSAYGVLNTAALTPFGTGSGIGNQFSGTITGSGAGSAAAGDWISPTLVSAAGTQLTTAYGQYVKLTQSTGGTPTALTNLYDFYADDAGTLAGTPNFYGYYSNIAAGTNKWALYMNGTAASLFNGPVTFNGAVTYNSTFTYNSNVTYSSSFSITPVVLTGSTGTYAVGTGDFFIINRRTVALALTLPNPASSNTGRELIIQNDADFVVTVGPFSAETINGESSFTIPEHYSSVYIRCDGTNWFIQGVESGAPFYGSQVFRMKANVNVNAGDFISVQGDGGFALPIRPGIANGDAANTNLIQAQLGTASANGPISVSPIDAGHVLVAFNNQSGTGTKGTNVVVATITNGTITFGTWTSLSGSDTTGYNPRVVPVGGGSVNGSATHIVLWGPIGGSATVIKGIYITVNPTTYAISTVGSLNNTVTGGTVGSGSPYDPFDVCNASDGTVMLVWQSSATAISLSALGQSSGNLALIGTTVTVASGLTSGGMNVSMCPLPANTAIGTPASSRAMVVCWGYDAAAHAGGMQIVDTINNTVGTVAAPGGADVQQMVIPITLDQDRVLVVYDTASAWKAVVVKVNLITGTVTASTTFTIGTPLDITTGDLGTLTKIGLFLTGPDRTMFLKTATGVTIHIQEILTSGMAVIGVSTSYSPGPGGQSGGNARSEIIRLDRNRLCYVVSLGASLTTCTSRVTVAPFGEFRDQIHGMALETKTSGNSCWVALGGIVDTPSLSLIPGQDYFASVDPAITGLDTSSPSSYGGARAPVGFNKEYSTYPLMQNTKPVVKALSATRFMFL